MHKHDWRPILHWHGRYRCATCFALGYSTAIFNDPRQRFEIQAYKCHKKQCQRLATWFDRQTRRKACPLHRQPTRIREEQRP